MATGSDFVKNRGFPQGICSERILKYHVGMGSAIEQFLSSELSRNSAAVFAAAEQAPVLVTRRDGEDLVLMSKRENSARKELLELAGQLLCAATDEHGSLVDRMATLFPWMLALSPKGQVDCARKLIQAARAAFATQQLNLLINEFESWRATAYALAEGLTAKSDDADDRYQVRPRVERPVAAG